MSSLGEDRDDVESALSAASRADPSPHDTAALLFYIAGHLQADARWRREQVCGRDEARSFSSAS